MHLRERHNETQFTYNIQVLWDRYAARGFGIALMYHAPFADLVFLYINQY